LRFLKRYAIGFSASVDLQLKELVKRINGVCTNATLRPKIYYFLFITK
jgi:hypothetical protein